MNAEIAGSLVAKFIDKQWPIDKESVYEVLRMGCNKAWQEGKWLGMTAEFFVPIHVDGNGQKYILAPVTHPILLALNSSCRTMTIRDEMFMFHKNGYGDVKNYPGCCWNQDVYDLGAIPFYNKNNINFRCGVKIGVRALGTPGGCEKVWINGSYTDGEKVYSYQNSTLGNTTGCSANLNTIDTISGVEIPVTSGFHYINNVSFSEITSITKTVTRTPIEVIVISCSNEAHKIARLEPNQRFSSYRKYLVPNDLCHCQCLHGLFKIAQQDKIVNPTDSIMISNEEALIALAKGIHNLYYVEQHDKGMAFIAQGINALEKEKREEESPDEFPIQVDGTSCHDLAEALKYYH